MSYTPPTPHVLSFLRQRQQIWRFGWAKSPALTMNNPAIHTLPQDCLLLDLFLMGASLEQHVLKGAFSEGIYF
jgi:hypothetical protein